MSITSVKNDNVGDSSFINSQKPLPPAIIGYTVNGTDDTALDPAGGQTVLINGSGFQRGATITFDGSAVAVVSFVSSSQLSFTSPAKSAGTYTIYVVNADGGTAIYIPGIIYSNLPTWTTGAGSLGSYYETTSISNTVVASGDAPITYSLYSGSLPTGATLYANGVITGTAPVDSGSTTYSFTIEAIDNELQGSTRSFSLTINTDVVTWSNPTNGATINLDGTAYSNVLSATSAAGYNIASYTANALPTGLSLSGNTISGTPSVEGSTTTLLTATAETTGRSATNTVTWVVSLGDAYINYVTTLLSTSSPAAYPFNDDASTNNFAITINGDTRPNNFNPYTPGYYSNYFDGTGDYLSFTNTTGQGVNFGTSDFTVELWYYMTDSTTNSTYQTFIRQDTATNNFDFGYRPGLAQLVLGAGNVGEVTASVTMTTNTWNHIAVSRSGTSLRFFVNGTQVGTTATNSYNFNVTGGTVRIGSNNFNAAYTVYGYLSNMRCTKSALYTTNFTPPTAPLTAITNTSLLTCQSNRFIDNSTNNFTITRNGDTKVSSFIPYTPSSSYSTYGSTYFDGTGDYLSVPYSASFDVTSTDFTIEAWLYKTTTGNQYIANQRPPATANGWGFEVYTGNQLRFYYTDGTTVLGTGIIPINTWTHVAVTRSGTTVRLFINGVVDTTATVSNGTAATNALYIGTDNTPGSANFTGNMVDFRLVKGTAVYTSAFTPPTEPLTAIANTSLLTCQTNQPVANNTFLDNSTNNFLVTRSGNTTQGTFSPYGENWSNYFDGTGDYLSAGATTTNFGTGDFTIEAWVYVTGSGIVVVSNQDGGTDVNYFILDANTTNVVCQIRDSGGQAYAYGPAMSSNTWTHLAVSRSSGSVRVFVNGTSGTPVTITKTITSRATIIGGFLFTGYLSYFNGYISNFRAVKGTALYTSNFTPSTTPLQPVTNTSLLTCQSSNIKDNSANNLTITKNGDVSVQKFGPFAGTTLPTPYYGAYFDGTGDYLTVPTSTSLDFGTGDFTVEAWVFPTSLSSDWFITSASGSGGLFVGFSSSGTVGFGWGRNAVAWDYRVASSATSGAWQHVAVTRSGTSMRLFVNGVQQGTTQTSSTSYNLGTTSTTIGSQGAAYYLTGNISNLRVVKGTALYTANFTPPTAPLTAVSGTSLLTCQSSTFIDNSTNNFTITANGDSKPTTFNPFTVSYSTKQSYTPAVYGGSMYFDGTGDYLYPAINSLQDLTGDFTNEHWCYPIGGDSWTVCCGTQSGSGTWYFKANTTTGVVIYAMAITTWAGVTLTSASNVLRKSAWNHLCATRSGNTFNLYVNGVVVATTTNSGSLINTGRQLQVGIFIESTGTTYFNGYLSDIRLVKGQALYTSNFVPGRAPLTPVKNTVLLLTGTSAGIYDSSEIGIYETVAETKLSHFGPYNGSYYSNNFDGSGDYLTTPSFSLTLATWTMEFWLYTTSTTQYQTFVHRGNGATWGVTSIFDLYMSGTTTGTLVLLNGTGGTQLNGTTQINNGVWHHVAVTYDGTNYRLFVDGKLDAYQAGSAMSTASYLFYIGYDPRNSRYASGYISNFRFVDGSVVYSTGSTTTGSTIFTPPTTPLTAIANTSLLTCQSNKFVDNSTNNFTITRNGDISVATQNPFQVNSGQSVIFDGTGDRLASNSGPTNSLGSGDFTIEGWIYCSTLPANARVLSQGSYTTGEYMWVMYAAGGADFTEASTARLTFPSGSFGAGKWTYFAIVRSGTGANNLKAYVDGVNVASATSTYNYSATTNTYIGCNPNQSGQDFNGYITDLRITKGVARYTTAFTPPTSPLSTK